MMERRKPDRLLVLADDLTGAADCAARCFAAGLPAQIVLVEADALPDTLGSGATCISADSRHLSAAAAGGRVTAIMARLAGAQGVRWYKKIDSTLRGNIGAELDAMLDSLAESGRALTAVVSPAFPAQRRGVEDGYLVHAGTAPRTVHLPTLLQQQSRRPATYVGLQMVRGQPDALAAHMRRLRQDGAQMLAVDALTDEDLAAICAAATLGLNDVLFCGSAGLVSVLARDMAQEGELRRDGDPGLAIPPKRGPVVVAVGSGSVMAHAQIARLRNVHGCVAVEAGGTASVVDSAASLDARVLLFHLPRPNDSTQFEGPEARAMADRLAQCVVEALHGSGANRLVLVGGDTAMQVLARLGVARLEVRGEIQPGMPLVTGDDAGGFARVVVLKAGNHGTEESLVEIVRALM
ncbi:MAG: four-carbon acid sugar kinase family protein [Chloroflexota bacterium]|nr:four-carbon acid sugar kinase family protein [Chloroflexota bacterium]